MVGNVLKVNNVATSRVIPMVDHYWVNIRRVITRPTRAGQRNNVIRIQPYGTGSSVKFNYKNGYFVVYNNAGGAINLYSGKTFRVTSPKVHNEKGLMIWGIGQFREE